MALKDKPIISGEGVLEVFNWAIGLADKALTLAQNKLGDLTGSMVAGVSELASNIGDRASSFTLAGGTTERVQECGKVGRSANVQERALGNSQYERSEAELGSMTCQADLPTLAQLSQGRSASF